MSVACVTQRERLDIEITGEDGETVFCEKNIQTETFEVPINASGTYKVIVHAEEHTGSFWIEPQE